MDPSVERVNAVASSLDISVLVDIAGILGFILSLALAAYEISRNRLRMSIASIVFIDAALFPDSFFLKFRITNRTTLPFTLNSVAVKTVDGLCFMSQTVRTFRQEPTADKLAVRPVVFSQEFPVRFDSCEARDILIELPRQPLWSEGLQRNAPIHSQAELPCRRAHGIRSLCTRQPLPQLVIYTSRGIRVSNLLVSEVQDERWLETFAVRKAGYEEKIVFD